MVTAYKHSTRQSKREDLRPSASRNSVKPLRQLAKELGVSASYLSQVKSGKRPASAKLLNMLSKNEGKSESDFTMVGHRGLEPRTPVLSGLCSNQLS
jgi:transcriptional regulator with XRE-family HTH domain